MLENLYSEGFIPVNGVTYADGLLSYLRDKSNYAPVIRAKTQTGESTNHQGIRLLPQNHLEATLGGYPKDISDELRRFKLGSHVVYCEKGFTMLPHRDFFELDDPNFPKPAVGTLLSYINPPSGQVIGRNLVYGKVTEFVPKEENPLEWGDPRLEKLGEIKPITGNGVLVDALNPDWWHGVTPLLSEGPVIVLAVTVYGC